ncbi:spore germination protein GerPC [Paenibacillus sp. sgz500958]|uniref:spore germination protein GerPC n=1 Tax=Paenibacillus sp. sgz500958 TaxID=3242475 RepID=UPI0036D283E9
MHPYYVQQVFDQLRIQHGKLEQLEKKISELQAEVDQLKSSPNSTIGPINYHFEQLKIEKLEGTLNIGITPNEGNGLEGMTVNGQQAGAHDATSPALAESIRPKVIKYVDEEVPQQFQRYAEEQQRKLNKQYVQMVTHDLSQQLGGRIDEYLSQLPVHVSERASDEIICASIVEQIKRDLDTAVKNHLEWSLEGGGNLHEGNNR